MVWLGRVGVGALLALHASSCASERRSAPSSAPEPRVEAKNSRPTPAEPPAVVSADAPPPADAATSPESSVSSWPPPQRTPGTVDLFGADGKLLEQTNDLPSTTSVTFVERIKLLFDAIVRDDPASARAAFFPLEAYEKVKAIKDPARDWNRRLIAAFERDIRAYHRKLGSEPEKAKLVALAVPSERARWMKPGSEGNKLGYHRVLRSELSYRDSAGRPGSLPILSMISWRGEWYIVHLKSFD